MRTNRELLAATKAFACEIRWESWWHLGSTLTLFGLLFGVASSDLSFWVRIPCSVALGLVLVRLFVLYHDYQHGAILRGSALARGIMWVFGMAMLNPPSSWKRSHDHHHAHNSSTFGPNVGSFSLMTVESFRDATRWKQICYAVERHPATIALGYLTVFFLGMCVGPFLANPIRHRDAAVSVVCHLGLLFCLGWAGLDVLLLAALIPCSIASAVGAFLFYAQHNFPGVRICAGQEWDYVSAALHSSGYIRMGPVLSWCTGNIGYHHVHHLNSRIPFYRLPEAMAAIEELQSPVTMSLNPRNILACFRLKLWDPVSERLVPWAALNSPIAR